MEVNGVIQYTPISKEVGQVDEHRIHLVPKNHELVDIDKQFDRSISARFNAESLESLVEYVEKFNQAERSIFISGGEVQVVLDYHKPDLKGTCKHVATYKARVDPVYQAIYTNNDVLLSQRAFVNFWTDYKAAVTKPSSVDLIESLQKIKVLKKEDSEHEATTTSRRTAKDFSSKVEIMDEFYVAIRPYLDLDVSIETLCRVHVDDTDTLKIKYRMPLLEVPLEEADKKFRALVEKAFGELVIPIYQGIIS